MSLRTKLPFVLLLLYACEMDVFVKANESSSSSTLDFTNSEYIPQTLGLAF